MNQEEDRSAQCKGEGEPTESYCLIWNQEVSVTQEAGSRCEEARVQKAENPGDVEGLEVKTGYSWKGFE